RSEPAAGQRTAHRAGLLRGIPSLPRPDRRGGIVCPPPARPACRGRGRDRGHDQADAALALGLSPPALPGATPSRARPPGVAPRPERAAPERADLRRALAGARRFAAADRPLLGRVPPARSEP